MITNARAGAGASAAALAAVEGAAALVIAEVQPTVDCVAWVTHAGYLNDQSLHLCLLVHFPLPFVKGLLELVKPEDNATPELPSRAGCCQDISPAGEHKDT